MAWYVLKRFFGMIPVLIIVTMAVFLLIQLTGDPVRALMGTGEVLDPEQMAYLRHEMGLDRPIPVQYAVWLGKAVRGDLGRSNITNRTVVSELSVRLPVTLELGIAAWLFSIIIAVPAGVVSAMRRGAKLDFFATVTTIGGVALPDFWVGMMLILIFGVQLHWLPTVGFVSIFDNPIQGLRHLVLPACCLGLSAAGVNMRQTRSAMLEVLSMDYVRTARAKGLSEWRVILVHALRNALLPVVTISGMQIGRIFGGAVVIETLFAIPGMGRLMVDSIFNSDIPIVQGCILVLTLAVVLANLVTDITYHYLDPRIRYGS
jgi:peptide/nickel transport system permease protein